MPEGGDIYLETSVSSLDANFCEPYEIQPGRYVRIAVADTGTGIHEAIRHRIFDPFFTTKEKGRGTGLGLASAYGIIKNHSGIITVHSDVGQGSQFEIYLPLSDQKAQSAKVEDVSPVKGVETILLVDDEMMITDVGGAMLQKLGYDVITANTGKQSIDIINKKSKTIHMVILDMIMPDLDGGKTFDGIRSIDPTMPVLLSSGYAMDNQTEEILKRGCNGFIQKPFNMSELSQKVRSILDSVTSS
jgi:CheY-like chemotaxis protein